jgi:V8-like Glu-specific endopeptidase
MDPIKCFELCNSGVFRIASIIYDGIEIGSGTGFLTKNGLVTNSHVIRSGHTETLSIRSYNENNEIRIAFDEKMVLSESGEDEYDYVLLDINEDELTNRYLFNLCNSNNVKVGQQVCFLGYPFGFNQITYHVGYISSVYEENSVLKYRIDGSINPGNSGGPLVSLDSGKVIGIITRAETGLLKQQFDELMASFEKNKKALEAALHSGLIINAAGVNPFEAILATQYQMEGLAANIKRSANVGIGYAFSTKYLVEAIEEQH